MVERLERLHVEDEDPGSIPAHTKRFLSPQVCGGKIEPYMTICVSL